MTELTINITSKEIESALNNLAGAINNIVANNLHTSFIPTASITPVTPSAPVTPTASITPVTPSAPVTPTASITPATPVSVPTSVPTYTLEMLAKAGSSLIDAGKLDALMSLLRKYSVDSLTSLKPDDYGSMATDLRTLGARI